MVFTSNHLLFVFSYLFFFFNICAILEQEYIVVLSLFFNETPRRRAAGYLDGIISIYRTKVRGIIPH